MHTLDPQLLERPISILVVGCGGNGSAIVSGLPYLHQAMLAFGHSGGLQVTLIDPDTGQLCHCRFRATRLQTTILPAGLAETSHPKSVKAIPK